MNEINPSIEPATGMEWVSYRNGDWVPASQCTVSVADAGFVWGATITDRVRTYAQKWFLLAEHLQRFQESCALAQVPLAQTMPELTAIAQELLARHRSKIAPHEELTLILAATPGPLQSLTWPPLPQESIHPTLTVQILPLNLARYQRILQQGAILLPSARSIDNTILPVQIKHRSRLHWWLAEQETHRQNPLAESLFVTAGDAPEFLETPSANFWAVLDGTVICPPKDCVLGGITGDFVRKLCHQEQIPCNERPLLVSQLPQISEAFLTNTSYGLAGVAQIGTQTFPFPGPILTRLQASWSTWLESARDGLDSK